MTDKKPKPAMEFVLAALKENPAISYADLRTAALAENPDFKIYPIMYGRAKALLGLVPQAPRGSKKKAKEAQAAAAPRAPQAGRPRRRSVDAAANNPLASLDAMIDDLKSVAEERDRFHDALEQIARILDEALGDGES